MCVGCIIRYVIVGKTTTVHYCLLYHYNEKSNSYYGFLICSKPSIHSVLVTKTDIPLLVKDSYIQLDNIHTIRHSNIKNSDVKYIITESLRQKIRKLWKEIKLIP